MAPGQGDLFDLAVEALPPICHTWHVGTSGYEFDDWVGTVYPPALRGRGLLAHYLNVFKFNALELNWTFYRMPDARALEGFALRTPRQYQLAVKVNQELTHAGSARVPEAACTAFSTALVPLRETGKLAALLFQFPYAFKNTGVNRAYIEQCRTHFPDDPVAFEFRHSSWHEAKTDTLLGSLGCAHCCVDEPALEGLMPLHAVAGPLVYARLHGRNRAWFTAGEKERYHYDYSTPELASVMKTIRTVSPQAKKILVFFNNCHMGHAVKNAMTFRDMVAKEAR